MKHRFSRTAALILTAVLMMLLATGCSDSGRRSFENIVDDAEDFIENAADGLADLGEDYLDEIEDWFD